MAAVDAKLDPRLEAKDSRSTLVEEIPRFERSETPHAQSPAPTTPASPFSASFDPNGPIPQTPQGILSPATTLSQRPSMPASQDAWTSSVAASLNNLASQFAAASTALATVPTRPNSDVQESFPALTMIEQAQSRLKDELETLREQVAHLMESGRRPEKEKEREKVEIPVEDYETRLQAVEKKVDELGEAIRLDQARLYARLQNSTVTTNKMTLAVPIMANGKIPTNFPATKGEFEHLTKERYEHLLKSYGVPLKGDTNAKRQTLREFIGLSPAKP